MGFSTVLQLRDGRCFYIAADDYLEWYLLLFGAYEPEITRLLPLLIQDTSVVIDVGANIGVHSLTMAKLAGNGRVIACEPHTVTIERLRANLVLNSVVNVEIVPFALLDRKCEVELYDNIETHKGMASLHAYDGWIKTTVPGTTLDDLVIDNKSTVDMIKVDVEGYEAPVLTGASEVLRRDRPSIIFEYVDWAWENCGFSIDATLKQLRDVGYDRFYVIDRSALTPLPQPFHRSGNILAVGRVAQSRHFDTVTKHMQPR